MNTSTRPTASPEGQMATVAARDDDTLRFAVLGRVGAWRGATEPDRTAGGSAGRYRHTRGTLVDELGVERPAALRELHEGILRGEAPLGLPTSTGRAVPAPRAPAAACRCPDLARQLTASASLRGVSYPRGDLHDWLTTARTSWDGAGTSLDGARAGGGAAREPGG